MAEDIWMCAIHGKVVESFVELAPAGAAVSPGNKVTLYPEVIAETLFGSAYAAFVNRASAAGKIYFSFAVKTAVVPPSLMEAGQEFLNACYHQRIREGNTPRESPEFYAMHARASKKTWPVYFLAVGMNLDLPAEAYYGKVALPK